MSRLLPDFRESLNVFFRGKAKWETHRDVKRDETLFSFQCDRQTPVMAIQDSLFKDARDAAGLLARRCLDLYERHHRTIGAWKQEPILTCRECRSPVDLPRESKLDFEFCERQSVLWAERAAAMVKR